MASSQPNVLFIMLDDASARDMSRAMRLIRGTDTSATGNSFVLSGAGNFNLAARTDITWLTKVRSEVSQCDPSRYTCYTGVRASSHGVTDNSFDGSFVPSAGMLHTVFKTAGYRVGHIGKIDHQNISAPAFTTDYYVIPASNATATYYGIPNNNPGDTPPPGTYSTYENGSTITYTGGGKPTTEENFFSDVLGMGLPSIVRLEDGTQVNSSRYAALGGNVPSKFNEWLAGMDSRPWFCVLAFENPHSPNFIAPRFNSGHPDNSGGQWFAGNVNLLPSTSAHFAHQSSPPQWITTNCPIPTTSGQTGMRQDERGTERSLLNINDQLNAVITRVQAQYPNTLIVLTSDQGIAFGEHCIEGFKCDPYDPAMIMLCGIIPPNATGAFTNTATGSGPWTDGKLLSNLDFASTICAVCGVPSPRGGPGIDIRTGTRASAPIFWLGGGGNPVPAFSGVATLTAKYWHYTNIADADYGFEELYDLTNDGVEMVNQAANPAYATLKASLLALTTP